MKNKHEATAWRVSTALSGEMARKLREGLPVAVIRTIVCLSRFIASNNAGIPLEFRELQRVTHVYFRQRLCAIFLKEKLCRWAKYRKIVRMNLRRVFARSSTMLTVFVVSNNSRQLCRPKSGPVNGLLCLSHSLRFSSLCSACSNSSCSFGMYRVILYSFSPFHSVSLFFARIKMKSYFERNAELQERWNQSFESFCFVKSNVETCLSIWSKLSWWIVPDRCPENWEINYPIDLDTFVLYKINLCWYIIISRANYTSNLHRQIIVRYVSRLKSRLANSSRIYRQRTIISVSLGVEHFNESADRHEGHVFNYDPWYS